MKNILIVCADKQLRKDLSKALATELKCLYLDANELLDFEMLNRQEVALSQMGEALSLMEQDTLKRVMEFKNCVITISHDLFVSNDNYKLLDGVVKCYLKLSKSYIVAKTSKADKHKLEQELNMFDEISNVIAANCDFVVDKSVKSIPELCQEVILNYNKIK